MVAFIRCWLQIHADRRAMTALEYAMIAGVVGAAVAVGFGSIAGNLTTSLNAVAGSV